MNFWMVEQMLLKNFKSLKLGILFQYIGKVNTPLRLQVFLLGLDLLPKCIILLSNFSL